MIFKGSKNSSLCRIINNPKALRLSFVKYDNICDNM